MRATITPLPSDSLRALARLARFMLAATFVALVALLSACDRGADDASRPLLLHPNGDVLTAGDHVSISDSVPGDVMAAAGDVDFDGMAGGSLLAAAGDVYARGRVDGSIRAGGGAVRIASSVGRNVTAVGGSVELGPEAVVQRNAYLGGGAVTLDGSVGGDAYVAGEAVTVNGHVGGDLRVECERLTIGPSARIEGELRYRLSDDGTVVISTQAAIAGGAEELEPREERDGLLFPMFRVLAFLLFGAVVVAVFPRRVLELVPPMHDRPLAAAGMGLLWGILTPVFIVVVAATVLGIPLAIAAGMLFGIVLYAAPIPPSLWLGSAILQGRDLTIRHGAVLSFLAGGFTIAFLGVLPIVGWVVRLIATLLGLGAVVMVVREAGPTRHTAVS